MMGQEFSDEAPSGERVQKLIAEAGLASRRKAEAWIVEGRVTIDGKVAVLGERALARQVVAVDGMPLPMRPELVYILLNKPANVISTASDPSGRTSVIDLVDHDARVFPVGRLDYKTTGTLLLTNDGPLAYKLMHPSYQVKRVYHAKLNVSLTEAHLSFLNGPSVTIDGMPSQQRVSLVTSLTYEVTLTAGLNHHVRKLFEQLGYEVVALNRVEFAGLSHRDGVPQGKWRKLTPHEIKQLRLLVS